MVLRRLSLPAVAVAALCVAACAPSSPPTGAPPPAATPASAGSATTPGAAGTGAATPAMDTGTALVAYQWQLETATDAAGQSIAAFFPAPPGSADGRLGLAFADGRVAVTGGCNRISGGYRLLDATNIEVSPAVSTMMACPPPQAKADAAVADFLRGALQVGVTGDAAAPRLRLAAANGTTLTFGGTPTPETRFGGPGTRAFLEVSPAPCAAPATRPCLTVRDRHFDDKGLQSAPPGEWRALPDGIEGYAPVEGQQQVVRVKRFESAAAGGEPKVHYVFDMVVESRTVP